MAEGQTVHQCLSCPWRVDCDPEQDIPHGYSVELHKKLRSSIAEPGALNLFCPLQVMACHYSEPGAEFPCAGWLHHQLGPGNNIALRLQVLRGQMPVPVVEGKQHPTFEATLPQNHRDGEQDDGQRQQRDRRRHAEQDE
jgi:hypothetical protein